MAKSSEEKQSVISLKMEMKLLKAVDQKQKTETKICKYFGKTGEPPERPSKTLVPDLMPEMTTSNAEVYEWYLQGGTEN
ncbi:hypothetical protein TNCV_1592421 [Trichonephila clavipes]|nr:hypothetical protein TNCV_1592421 [Trichonephila clavipes]